MRAFGHSQHFSVNFALFAILCFFVSTSFSSCVRCWRWAHHAAFVVTNPLGILSNTVIVALAAVALNGALACTWTNFADAARAYAGVAVAVGALQLVLGVLSCIIFRDSVAHVQMQFRRENFAVYELN